MKMKLSLETKVKVNDEVVPHRPPSVRPQPLEEEDEPTTGVREMPLPLAANG